MHNWHKNCTVSTFLTCIVFFPPKMWTNLYCEQKLICTNKYCGVLTYNGVHKWYWQKHSNLAICAYCYIGKLPKLFTSCVYMCTKIQMEHKIMNKLHFYENSFILNQALTLWNNVVVKKNYYLLKHLFMP